MNKRTDEELIIQIKADKEQAFQQLFERHYAALCRRSYRLCRDQQTTEDIAQDVFLSIWTRRSQLDITSNVRAYLMRAMVYKTIDYLRKKIDHVDLQYDNESSAETAEQVLEGEQVKQFLNRCIDGLPDRCRMVFILSRYEQLSHKEIAVKMGISVKTIENQITKALKIIRAALEKYESL